MCWWQWQVSWFLPLLGEEISFIVDLYHGVHQPVGHLQVLQDIQHVHLLTRCLWMADVSNMNQKILKWWETQPQSPVLKCATLQQLEDVKSRLGPYSFYPGVNLNLIKAYDGVAASTATNS